MTNIPPLHTPAPVPAYGAVSKSPAKRATADAINSDTVVRTDPYAEHVTKTAYKVKRSNDTDTATLHPFCELWASGDCIARILPEKPENVGFMEVIQKSMARPWNSLGHGEDIELHPAIRVTFPRRLGENADKPVSMKQAAFKDDIERDSDRRQRALWTCRCLAETKHVAAYADITSKYITGAAEIDLDAALAAINARAKEPGATIVHPNIEAATEISKEYQKTMTRNAGSGELDKALDRKADKSINPLDDVAEINEVLAMTGADPLIVEHKVLDDKPKSHWSADSSWRKAVKDERMKYRLSAALTSDEFSDWLHKIFDVKSLKELTMTPETALDIIADTLKKEFAPPPAATDPSATTSATATNAVAGATVPETPKDAPAGKVEPQSGNVSEVQKTSEIVNDKPAEPSHALTIVQAPANSLAALPMIAQWDLMRQQATVLLKSGFLPQSIKTPEQAITIMMMGQALGIEPIVALNTINVIQGKPTVSPQLMLALVRRSGQLESFKCTDDGTTCTVIMKRRGEPEHTETFSMSDAAAMQLAGKDNWKKQPATMRKWRTVAAACRVVFPDVTWGIASYTTEEIDPDLTIDYAA